MRVASFSLKSGEPPQSDDLLPLGVKAKRERFEDDGASPKL